MPASAATLFAGWDAFNSPINPTATHLAADTTATLSSSATGGNWDDWNGNDGASSDGTFGSLGTTIATATTDVGTGSNQGTNLSLNRSVKLGSLIITLTNTSGADRTMDGFYFDSVGRFALSAKTWDLSFSGAISGTAATGVLVEKSMMQATATERDWAVDLSGLADNVWEAGQSAVFTLTFSGGTTTLTGGGHEALVDNIGITANVVPEPSSFAMFALGLTGLLIRRRK